MELRDLRHLVDTFLANAGYPLSDSHSPGPFVLPLMDDRTLGIEWRADDDEVILFANPGYALRRQTDIPSPRAVSGRPGNSDDVPVKNKGRGEAFIDNIEDQFEDEYGEDTDHAIEYPLQDAFREYEDHDGDAGDDAADAGINLGTDEFGRWMLHIDDDSSLATLCLHVPLRTFGPQEFIAAVDQFRDKFEIWVEALQPTPPVADSPAHDANTSVGVDPHLALLLRA